MLSNNPRSNRMAYLLAGVWTASDSLHDVIVLHSVAVRPLQTGQRMLTGESPHQPQLRQSKQTRFLGGAPAASFRRSRSFFSLISAPLFCHSCGNTCEETASILPSKWRWRLMMDTGYSSCNYIC